MQKRRRLFLILIGVGVLGGVIAVVFRSAPEPEYGGKRLSEWVEIYADAMGRAPAQQPPPNRARSRLGTNSIPYLVKWMGYEPSIWKTTFYRLVNPIIWRINPSWEFNDDKQRLRALGSVWAFTLMGTNARPAMPLLHQLLKNPNELVRIAASNLVFEIDPQALDKATAQ